jgi:hypothetical protein
LATGFDATFSPAGIVVRDESMAEFTHIGTQSVIEGSAYLTRGNVFTDVTPIHNASGELT